MCVLCGVVGDQKHWTDAVREFHGELPPATADAERARRIELVNRVLRHYGMSVTDNPGGTFVLRSGEGMSAIVPNLSELWAAAGWMRHDPCDPLDAGLIEALRHEAAPRGG